MPHGVPHGVTHPPALGRKRKGGATPFLRREFPTCDCKAKHSEGKFLKQSELQPLLTRRAARRVVALHVTRGEGEEGRRGVRRPYDDPTLTPRYPANQFVLPLGNGPCIRTWPCPWEHVNVESVCLTCMWSKYRLSEYITHQGRSLLMREEVELKPDGAGIFVR